MSTSILIVPGIGSSGPEHWQSRWEAADPRMRRVEQADWDHPDRRVWQVQLARAVDEAGPDVLLVAHSLGCLLVAHWAAETRLPVRGALLVAVPDPEGPAFPPEATGFAPVPRQPLGFASLVVASEDDPYGSPAHAEGCAAAWGSRLLSIGAAGHINAASGLGDWPQG
ncbi:RBBP9/YdeN family alpha/beta hydrolase [Stutzerimonas azotifigens]|uniref:RBBP9/YdeN family alpha/beta hydrolase n=1 Tax=Stutzerimonas azotifigens TaxID=291995 RepID=UPI000404AD40|nr:alpha/beta hydrolase [Stutzerimonas azotifigens]